MSGWCAAGKFLEQLDRKELQPTVARLHVVIIQRLHVFSVAFGNGFPSQRVAFEDPTQVPLVLGGSKLHVRL